MGRTLAVPACKRMRMGTRTWIRCGEGQIFDDETDYFSINFLPTWTPALGEAHNLTTCSLPICCRQTLLFDFRCGSVSSSTPSSRFLRRRRAYSYGQSVSSRSTIQPTSEAFLGLRCSHPNIDSPQPTAIRPVWLGMWDPGPNLLSLKSLKLFLLSPSRSSPLR